MLNTLYPNEIQYFQHTPSGFMHILLLQIIILVHPFKKIKIFSKIIPLQTFLQNFTTIPVRRRQCHSDKVARKITTSSSKCSIQFPNITFPRM